MNSWLDIHQAAHERQAEIRRFDAQHRVLDEVILIRQEDRSRPFPFYRRGLARIGRWMVAWGWRLQARHGALEFRDG